MLFSTAQHRASARGTDMHDQATESAVERAMNRLDARLMAHEAKQQSEYDREVATLDKWAQAQYRCLI